jgi:hypothetical protein
MDDMFGVRPTVRLRARGGSVLRIGEQGRRALAVPRAHVAQHVEPSERSHQGYPKHAYTFRTRCFARIAVWNGQVCGAQRLTRGLRLRGRQQPVAKLVQVRRGNPFNASGSTRCRKFRDRPAELQMKRVAGPRKDPSLNHSEQTTSSGVCHSTRFEPALHASTLLDCARPGSSPCLPAT